MNNYERGLQQYKVQSVNTMTAGEMLTLLYDELIKRLRKAAILLEHKNYELFEKEAQRCEEIVLYFRNSLNRKYGISVELDRLYEFFQYQIIRLKAGRNKQIIEELIPLVTDLRDTFQEASTLAMKHEEQK